MQSRGLGKGLSALIPGAGRTDTPTADIPVDSIRPNPHQPRTSADDDALEELAISIRSQGIVQPIVIRPAGEGYEIIAGERRWRAAKMAGLATVPAVVREATDSEMPVLALVENLQREDLNPVDCARAYRQITEEFGWTQEALSQAVGRSRTAISNTLRLLKLPLEIQQRIQSGHLSEGHGRALLAVPNEEERMLIWQRIERDGLTVREAEDLVRRTTERGEPAKKTKPARDPDPLRPFLEEIEDSLRQTLGTEVKLKHTRSGGGFIAIRYYDAEDLERLARLMVTFGSVPSSDDLGLPKHQ